MSRNAIPDRIIPALGQPSEYDSKPPSKQSWYVFHDDESGSKCANDPEVLKPEARPSAVEPGPGAGVAEILAGETSADDVDGSESFGGSDIVISPGVGPVLREDSAAERVSLNLPNGGAEARALEAKFEPTDATEE